MKELEDWKIGKKKKKKQRQKVNDIFNDLNVHVNYMYKKERIILKELFFVE